MCDLFLGSQKVCEYEEVSDYGMQLCDQGILMKEKYENIKDDRSEGMHK